MLETKNLNGDKKQPPTIIAVGGCCSSSDNISKVYLLDSKDCVFENGVMVRMKRKYGKFKRVVHILDYNNR